MLTLLRFETRHYEFLAIENNREDALKLLRRAWVKHVRLSGADPDLLQDNLPDLLTLEIEPGTVLMDWEPFNVEPGTGPLHVAYDSQPGATYCGLSDPDAGVPLHVLLRFWKYARTDEICRKCERLCAEVQNKRATEGRHLKPGFFRGWPTIEIPLELQCVSVGAMWEDHSYHNDLCGNLIRRLNAPADLPCLRLWVEHAKPEDREQPGDVRYILELITSEEQYSDGTAALLYKGDDLAEVQRHANICISKTLTDAGRPRVEFPKDRRKKK